MLCGKRRSGRPMKIINKAGLLILTLFLIFMAGSCALSIGDVYYYPPPGEIVPYETIIDEYDASIGENISEKEAQELFTILKNLSDSAGHRFGEGEIYIPEPFDMHVDIRLHLMEMERGENCRCLDGYYLGRSVRDRVGDEIDEVIEVHMGEHYGDWDSLYGWHNYFYFKRASQGGWYLISCLQTVE
jgi:hypothetical protein